MAKRLNAPRERPVVRQFVLLLATTVLGLEIEQVRFFVFPQRASKSLLAPQKTVRPGPLSRARLVFGQPPAALVRLESGPAFSRSVRSIAVSSILSLAVSASLSPPLRLAALF